MFFSQSSSTNNNNNNNNILSSSSSNNLNNIIEDFNDSFIIENTNNYINLEDLEKQINKESLLYFSNNLNKLILQEEQQNNNYILQSFNTNNNLNNTENQNLNEKRPTKCVVCTGIAKCNYFDVPSCIGCRSFFRRSILGQQRLYTCKNNKNCQIQKGDRCRACRFDQCLLSGMDFRTLQKFPDGIEINKINNILTERKRQLISKKTLGFQENSIILHKRSDLELLKMLKYSDDCFLHIRYSETDLSTIFPYKSIFDILQSFNVNCVNQSILSKFNMFSKKRIIPKNSDYFFQKIREGNFSTLLWLFIDSFLFIEITKTWPIIQQLSFEDKLKLYFHNGPATIIFGQVFYSKNIQESEIFIFPCGFTPLFIINKKNHLKLFYNNLLKIKEANLTREEFLLLRSAIFFHTALTDLSSNGCKILQIELDKLSQALMLYERNKWGDIGGAERFTYLMLLITTTFQFGKTHRKFLKNYMEMRKNLNKMNHPKFVENLIFGK